MFKPSAAASFVVTYGNELVQIGIISIDSAAED